MHVDILLTLWHVQNSRNVKGSPETEPRNHSVTTTPFTFFFTDCGKSIALKRLHVNHPPPTPPHAPPSMGWVGGDGVGCGGILGILGILYCIVLYLKSFS